MNRIPTSRDEMAAMLESAFILQLPPQGASVNEEHLALFAEGRGEELAPADRDRLLAQIASDCELAELLADLIQPGAIAAREARAQKLEAKKARPGLTMNDATEKVYRLQMWTQRLWAIAACLMLGLGGWWMLFPSMTTFLAPINMLGGAFHSMGVEPPPAHPGFFSYHTLELCRDVLWVISIGLTALLSIPVAYWQLRSIFRR